MTDTAPRMARRDVDTAAQKWANSLVSVETPVLSIPGLPTSAHFKAAEWAMAPQMIAAMQPVNEQSAYTPA